MTQDLGIGTRIKELRAQKGLSQKKVSEKLFVSQAAYSFMENSQHGISSEHLLQLCELYNVTADYLLTGNKNLVKMTAKNGFLPLLNSKAHAGFLKNAHEDPDEEFEYYKVPGFNPTSDSVLIEIVGDSMQPTVMAGVVLICQPQKNYNYVLDGSIAVLVTENGLFMKRLFKHENNEYFWVAGDNPEEEEKNKIRKSQIKTLYMVLGKVSSVLIPHREMAFKGKIQRLEESLEGLNQEVYNISKKLDKLVPQRKS